MKVGGSITLQQSARFSQDCSRPGTNIKDFMGYNEILQHATGAAISRLQLIQQNVIKHPYTVFSLVDYLENFYHQSTYTVRYYGNYELGRILKKIFVADLTLTTFRCFY